MKELIEKTSIRNLKIIFSPRNFRLSKLFWLLSYAFAISGFGYYIYTAYDKLKHNPEIIKSTREADTKDFPFPAVTICSNIFTKNNLSNYQVVYNNYKQKKPMNLTEEECFAYTANLQWCDPRATSYLKEFCNSYDYESIDVIKTIRETAFDMKQLRSVRRYVTPFGYCFSMNMLNPRMIFSNETDNKFIESIAEIDENNNRTEPTWTPEKGYINGSEDLTKIHLRQATTSRLILNAEDEDNFCLRKQFRIFIHRPNEIITEYHEPIYVNNGFKIEVFVSVKSLRTDDALRGFSIDVRKCYFEGERQLKFFKTYTKALCEWECWTNATLEKCGCVKFSMPRDENTKVCNANELGCELFVGKKTCCCYSPCNDVEYSYTTDSFYISRNDIFIKVNPLLETVEEIENLLSYKISNFIADFGGFLGLFLGSSLLSILESCYFIFKNFKCSSKRIAPEDQSQNETEIEAKVNCESEVKLHEMCMQTKRELEQRVKAIDEQRKGDREMLKKILSKLDAMTDKNDAKISNDDMLIDEIYVDVKEM